MIKFVSILIYSLINRIIYNIIYYKQYSTRFIKNINYKYKNCNEYK